MQAFSVRPRDRAPAPQPARPHDATPFAGSGVDLTTRVEQEESTPATRKAWLGELTTVNRRALLTIAVLLAVGTLGWWAADALVLAGPGLLTLRAMRLVLLLVAGLLLLCARYAQAKSVTHGGQVALVLVSGALGLGAAWTPATTGLLVPLVLSLLLAATLRVADRQRAIGLTAQACAACAPLLAWAPERSILASSYLAGAAGLAWLLGRQLMELERGAFMQRRVAHAQAAALSFVHAAFDGVEQSLEGEVEAQQRHIHRLSVEVKSSRETERRRMAQDLHDNLGQLAAAARIDLSRLRPFKSLDGRLAARLERLELVVEQLLQAAREVIEHPRPRVLEERGLAMALAWLTQRHELVTGCPCTLSLEPPAPALGHDQSAAVFRIVQEALNNVAKHAEASRVRVELRVAGNILLEIRDDGCGFEPEQTRPLGLGLSGIQQRARDVGGVCSVLSQPGRGTTIRVQLPQDLGQLLAEAHAS